jgi:hypothetical protein
MISEFPGHPGLATGEKGGCRHHPSSPGYAYDGGGYGERTEGL